MMDKQTYRRWSKHPVLYFLNRDLPAIVPGADAAVIILTTVATTLAYVGAMTVLINFMAADFTHLITRVPNFEFQIINGQETGNPSFLIFSILRDVSFGLFGFIFFLFGAFLILKQAQLASNETMKKMLQGAVIGVIILMIFPYIWDPISDTAEMSALSLMNPLYTFDPDNPCPAVSSPRDVLFMQHMTVIAEHSIPLGLDVTPESVCRTDLLPNYLFAKAIFGADQALEYSEGSEIEWWDIGSKIGAQLQVFSDSIMSVLFVGLTKTSMLFFLTSMAVFISDMRFLLVDVIAMALPLLLLLKCVPFLGIDKLSDTLTTIFIPLLFAPVLAALIMLSGATDLVIQEERVVIIDDPDDITSIVPDRFLFSLHAMATLTLVIMSPVLFVPMLGNISSMMAKMTMTGIMSGIMGTAGVAKGAIGGGMSAFSGLKTSGNMGTMGAVGSLFTHPGNMGSVMRGMTTGTRSSMPGAFKTDLGSGGQILHGGGLGNLISNGGGDGDKAYVDGMVQGAKYAESKSGGGGGGGKVDLSGLSKPSAVSGGGGASNMIQSIQTKIDSFAKEASSVNVPKTNLEKDPSE